MIQFQDLTIRGDNAGLKDFLSGFGTDFRGWKRDLKREERINDDADSRYVALMAPEANDTPPATLFLFEPLNEGIVSVANIVPRDNGELTTQEYNRILQLFYDECVRNRVAEYGLEAVISKESVSAEDFLSPVNVALLQRFTSSANKSTGSSHPLDQARWFEFICSTFRSGEVLDGSILRGLLIEQEWTEEKAYELSSEYEFAISLLKKYTE